MFFVYNFLQVMLLIIAFPVLFIFVCIKKKYRTRILRRLGLGLPRLFGTHPDPNKKVIWIHALSVGEVTSALPLIKGLREAMTGTLIVFSASTSTGVSVAEKNIRPYVDFVISAPLDLLFSVNLFIKNIQPDLFILVETDFWPNWITRLRQQKIPAILVNGRISQQSFTTYQRFRFFFAPLFKSFSMLSMQTNQDANQMVQLGVPEKKIITLGNLKYDTAISTDKNTVSIQKSDFRLPADSVIWLCGSTHQGEEEIIIKAFKHIKKENDDLVLIIAPRDPGRSSDIIKIADKMGFSTTRRTSSDSKPASVLILDTIGELTGCYRLAKVAFIGGSLVQCGGHNPLEAAAYGVPVLFGPHMDDFQEIAQDIVHCKAGVTVHNAEEISHTMKKLLNNKTFHAAMGQAGAQLVDVNSGVVSHHVTEIKQLLS